MTQSISRNALISAMSAGDRALLAPHLEHVDLPLRFQFVFPNRWISHVYFPEHGLGSVLVCGRDDRQIEVGVIGREGITGMGVILGDGQSPHATFMQVAGHGLRIASDLLVDAMAESPSLQRLMMRAAQVFSIQMAYTALANGQGKIDERLARWLLMCQDRLGTNDLPITHEFLSLMLGVLRAGVTEAIQDLHRKDLVIAHRGVLTIANRPGLEALAGGLYGVPEAEHRRLIGSAPFKMHAFAESQLRMA